MQKNNMSSIYKKILNILVIVLILLFFGYFFYTLSQKNEIIKNNQKIVDSLRIEIVNYNKKYDSLQIVANKLDTLIQQQEVKVVTIKERFIVYKTDEIKDPSEAYKYVIKFIQE